MKKFAMLVVVLAFSLVGNAQTSSGEQTKIIALENAWNLAEQRKDVKALDELLGSGLVYIDYDGSVMSKAEFLASVNKPSLHPNRS
jgi:hypothetical protein